MTFCHVLHDSLKLACYLQAEFALTCEHRYNMTVNKIKERVCVVLCCLNLLLIYKHSEPKVNPSNIRKF